MFAICDIEDRRFRNTLESQLLESDFRDNSINFTT